MLVAAISGCSSAAGTVNSTASDAVNVVVTPRVRGKPRVFSSASSLVR